MIRHLQNYIHAGKLIDTPDRPKLHWYMRRNFYSNLEAKHIRVIRRLIASNGYEISNRNINKPNIYVGRMSGLWVGVFGVSSLELAIGAM